jgi:hypothetical protein
MNTPHAPEVLDELAGQANQILYFEATAPEDLAYEALKDRLLAIYEAGYEAGKGAN